MTNTGGKHYSQDVRLVDADGNEINMWSEDAQKILAAGAAGGNDDEDEENESAEGESGEESKSEDEAGPSSSTRTMTAAERAATELSREERRREKKARKEAAIARARQQAVQVGDLPPSDSEDDDGGDDGGMPANPNHSRQARNQAKSSGVDEATEGVKKLSVAPSRRERELLEAKQAELQATEQAKADLARLKAIRERREAEAARKQVCTSLAPSLSK